MVVDSLDELKAAFDDWRRAKVSRRESAPSKLAQRARRAVGIHGIGAVAKATGMTYTRLRGSEASGPARKSQLPVAIVPSYSRVEVVAPAARQQAVVEVEMTSGIKVRAFVLSAEALGLLSTLCGAGCGQ